LIDEYGLISKAKKRKEEKKLSRGLELAAWRCSPMRILHFWLPELSELNGDPNPG
jgi:hypothetical protein